MTWKRTIAVALLSTIGTAGCGDGASPTAPASQPSASAARAMADRTGGQIVVATGLYETSVPADVFGVAIQATFAYATESHGGSAVGHFTYTEQDGAGAPTYRYSGRATCVGLYDFDGLTGNRAKIGGVVEFSSDPTIPVGTFMWWQSIDEHGHGRSKTTLAGFGDAAANSAFCASANPPRFGPFDVQGLLKVASVL